MREREGKPLTSTGSVPDFIPGFGWQQDAKYMYYLHGPLARTEIGQNKVQGIDYSYTIHGWLKAVNDGLMQNGNDPGLDGNIPSSGSNPNRWSGRDVAGLELGYYHSTTTVGYDDYNAIGNNGHISTKTGSNFKETQVPLYNGNINHTVTTLPNKAQIALNNVVADPLGTNYQYDQLNRLKESINYTNVNTGTNAWQSTLSPGTIPQQWQMRQSYDPMGNITSLVRHAQGGSGVAMDSLVYNYDYGTPTWNNQLLSVDDIITSGAHTEDIDDQAANNYDYDEIGNLISDAAEEIQSIEWTVYGKIKKITRTATSTKPDLEFEYNTAGQRVVKRVIDNTNNPEIVPYTIYYIRDASGNIMAMYRHITDIYDPDWPGEGIASAAQRFIIEDWHLYGSSRLGIASATYQLATVEGLYEYEGDEFTPIPETFIPGNLPADGVVTYFKAGWKHYELTNHLGNVLATFTDRKVPSINAVTGSFNFFNAQVTTVTDYYPFGMQIEERSWYAGGTYRFGYQGQEGDNEIDGKGDYLAFEYRVHDARLGRFLSIDPLTSKYPYYSPYSFSGNRVIDMIELEGLEPTTPEYMWSSTNNFQMWGDYYKTGGTLMIVEGFWVYTRAEGEMWNVHYYWNRLNNQWEKFEPAKPLNLHESIANYVNSGGLYHDLSIVGHTSLDFIGLVPVFGEVADLANAVWYYAEGNYIDGTLSLTSVVPIADWFIKGAKYTGRVIAFTFAYANEVKGLIQQTIKYSDEAGVAGKEVITLTRSGSFADAKTVTNSVIGGLGDDAVDYVSRTNGPFKDKVVGLMSPDGKKGWRIDWDDKKGAHINWWNGKEKGAIPFTGDLEKAKSIVENQVFK